VIFYQNMTNLHNRYKSAERKINPRKTQNISVKIGAHFDLNKAVMDNRRNFYF